MSSNASQDAVLNVFSPEQMTPSPTSSDAVFKTVDAMQTTLSDDAQDEQDDDFDADDFQDENFQEDDFQGFQPDLPTSAAYYKLLKKLLKK